jgi:hypothetical protein
MTRSTVSIFLAYAEEDREEKERLVSLLRARDRAEVSIQLLDYNQNHPGSWKQQLDRYVRQAQIALLLLSEDFILSTHCRSEVDALVIRPTPPVLIPIHVKDCNWRDHFPALQQFEFPLKQGVVCNQSDLEAGWRVVADFVETEIAKQSNPLRRPEGGSADSIRWAVASGAFTPLLGTACTKLGENLRRARPELERRLEWLLGAMRGKRERQYVVSLRAAKLPGGRNLSPTRYRGNDRRVRLLIDLQSCLVRLGLQAGEILVQALSSQPCCIDGIGAHSVALGLVEESQSARLRSLCFAAANQAAALEDAPELDRPELGLGILGIRNQLVWLTWSLFSLDLLDGVDEDCRKWSLRYPLDSPFRPSVREPRLYVAQLEWLAKLLWHTLRYDALMYPGDDELAFQLAVCMNEIFLPRTKSVGEVTLLAREAEVERSVIGWYSAIHAAGSRLAGEPRGLTEAVARALAHRPREMDPTSPPKIKNAARHLAVAVDMNLDSELVNTFRRRDLACSLLFPVTVSFRRSRRSKSEHDWLLLMTAGAGPQARLLGNDTTSAAALKARVPGPLVVKLRGAPLEEVPAAGEIDLGAAAYLRDASRVEVRHRLILSDYDAGVGLFSIAEAETLPMGVRDLLLEPGRTLCFIGYSVEDLSGRLRFLQQMPSDDRSSDVLVVIEDPRDPITYAFLRQWRAEMVALGLDKVAAVIHGTKGLPELPATAKGSSLTSRA